MTTITLDVGGILFKTTKDTLLFSDYFRSLFSRWKINDVIFIDRSGVLFEHVLCLLRNPEYPYPKEHTSELDFYGIKHNISKSPNEYQQKVDILWNEFRSNNNKCLTLYCDNIKDKQLKYCFVCKPPKLVPFDLNLVSYEYDKEISWAYFNNTYVRISYYTRSHYEDIAGSINIYIYINNTYISPDRYDDIQIVDK